MITKPSARTAPEALLRSGLEKTFGMTDHPKRDLLWRKAWERGHANGLQEVENEYRDLAELVPDASEADRLRSEVDRLTAALASADSVWSTTCEQQAQRIAQLERAMPHETSESIAAWQNATFGKATTTFSRISRSSQAIFAAMAKASGADLKVPRPNLSRAIRAAEELAELIEMLVVDDGDPDAGVEVADIEIVLAGIIAAHGMERADLVDTKMQVNRSRRRNMTGDGHGQHVSEESADVPFTCSAPHDGECQPASWNDGPMVCVIPMRTPRRVPTLDETIDRHADVMRGLAEAEREDAAVGRPTSSEAAKCAALSDSDVCQACGDRWTEHGRTCAGSGEERGNG